MTGRCAQATGQRLVQNEFSIYKPEDMDVHTRGGQSDSDYSAGAWDTQILM
jgi:hypothetical protein